MFPAPAGTEEIHTESKLLGSLELEVERPDGKKTSAQSLSRSKSSLLRFLRLGLHPGIDWCLLINSFEAAQSHI